MPGCGSVWAVLVKLPATSHQVMGYGTMRPNQQDCVTEMTVFCSELSVFAAWELGKIRPYPLRFKCHIRDSR